MPADGNPGRIEYLTVMGGFGALELLAKAEYPGPAITGSATLALLAFIIGGGYWMKHAEAKSREKELLLVERLRQERAGREGSPSVQEG